MHKIPGGTSKMYTIPRGTPNALFKVNHEILCIFRRSSWDFAHYLKSIMGFFAFSKDPCGILCIFGSFSWDFVHFWKFLVGLC
jgi:hypothetical protein